MEQGTITNIVVKNAGLVLLNSYYPLLFERTGLIKDFVFTDAAAREKAAYYLQFLATGHTTPGEDLLALNKVLCGIAPATLIAETTELPTEHKTIIEGLINAAIAYWPAISATSLEGFRGNWLIRNGMLIEKDDRWELTVEKRAYDILLHKAPFSFSIIKYPWMKKALRVNWTY